MTTLTSKPSTGQIAATETLNAEIHSLHHNTTLQTLVQHAPQHVLLLNTKRQIVYANATYLAMAEAAGLNGSYGQLLGDYIGCMHAKHTAGSCGTRPACGNCGALNAIHKSLNGAVAMQRCAIPIDGKDDPLYLVTLTIPVQITGSIYILTVFVDDNTIIEHPHTLAEHAFAVQKLAGRLQAA